MEFMNLSIKTVAIFVNDLAIEWVGGKKTYILLRSLRLACPCAGCSGESSVFGNIPGAASVPSSDNSFQINSYELVGLYALRFFWKDNHSDGLYPFKLLMSLSDKK